MSSFYPWLRDRYPWVRQWRSGGYETCAYYKPVVAGEWLARQATPVFPEDGVNLEELSMWWPVEKLR